MTQPLNYTIKAIEALSSYPCPAVPLSLAGMNYLAGKLRAAEVFVLPDHGEMLDRSKPRPDVPGCAYTPPFPVVALEYTSAAPRREHPIYTAARSSRRIALAWQWNDDLPPELRAIAPGVLGPGVVVASIYYSDENAVWFPVSAAIHFAFDDAGRTAPTLGRFAQQMIEAGEVPKGERGLAGTLIPILPEVIEATVAQIGVAAFDHLNADLMDEVNAYLDLCTALACANVSTHRVPAAAALNRARIRGGKLPLKDFHVLQLAGGRVSLPSAGGRDRTTARSHLRRGHVRRFAPGRVTWVNATFVRGRGFVDKVYAA